MIEKLEEGPEATAADALGPAALLASIRASRSVEDAEAARAARPRGAVGRPAPTGVDPLRRVVHRGGVRARGTHRRTGYAAGRGVLRRRARHRAGHHLGVGEEAHRPRPRAAPPSPATVGAGPRRARAGLAGPAVAEATIHSTPALTVEAARFVDTQVAAVAGKIGPAQLDRLVAETIKRFDLADSRPGRGPGGRLPPRRPAPRHDPRRGRPLRRHRAARGRDRPRRRARPPPGARPRRGHAEGPRVAGVARRTSRQGARRPGSDADRARPPRPCWWSTGSDSARRRYEPAIRPPRRPRGRAPRPLRRQPVRRHRRSFGPTGRLEEGQRLRPARPAQVLVRATPARRSPSSRVIDLNQEKSAPGYAVPDRIRDHVVLRDRTCACSAAAAGPPAAATSTTSPSTTTTPRQKADPNPGRPTPATWARCAGSTTGSRPTVRGATT